MMRQIGGSILIFFFFGSSYYLADAVVEGQGLYAELLHALQLLLVEVLQLVQRQDPVTVQVHAPAPAHTVSYSLRLPSSVEDPNVLNCDRDPWLVVTLSILKKSSWRKKLFARSN